MKKIIKREDELVTKGFLESRLKKEIGKVRDELHETEFRLIHRMDSGFGEIREEMKKHTDIIQKLADNGIVAHKNFEVESVNIRHNYVQLEERVKNVEEVVFHKT